jgi:hypothetical protein
MEDVLAIIFIFGGGTMVALAMSPVGRALAVRIQHGPRSGDLEELRQLRDAQQAVSDEVEAVRRDLMEMQERLDFAERMLTRQREDPRLPGPGAGA